MNIYADASALLKLFLREAGSDEMAESAQGSSVACVAIGLVELRAGLARAWRNGRLAHETFQDQLANVGRLWAGIASLPVNEALIKAASRDAEQYGLRAYDAVHLAALQAAGAPHQITFACWDQDLRQAAGALGYELLPETL